MSFTDQAQVAENPDFQARVRQAVCFAAMNAMGELKDVNWSDQKFAKRQDLARQILLTGGATFTEAFSWLVSVFNGGIIQLNAPDNDIQFAVNSLFDDMSGVRSTD